MEQLDASIRQSELPIRDCRELDAFREQEFLKSYATSTIVTLAPMLKLTQVSDSGPASGMEAHIEIRDVKSMSNKLIRVEATVDYSQVPGACRQNHTLYSIRTLSASAIEPFLCITRTGSEQSVTAFESASEYIACKLDGDETAILKTIRATAEEKGMRALLRFINLITQNLT